MSVRDRAMTVVRLSQSWLTLLATRLLKLHFIEQFLLLHYKLCNPILLALQEANLFGYALSLLLLMVEVLDA